MPAVLLVVALVLAGCGGDGGGDGGGGGDTRAAPVSRDELRIAVGEDIWPLTGRGPSSKHFAAGDVNVNIYEPLVSLGSDYTLRPGLAERWELVGPTTWRFHLRLGVTFHDGRPFGADDVVWSWSREFLPTSVTRTLGSVTKVDERTVDFNLTSPNLRLPEQLVHPEGPIVPRTGHNDSTPPVGTGPYKVVEYVPRQRVVVERFDDYWGEKAKVRKLTFRFLPEAESRREALQSGEIDVAAGPPLDGMDPRFRLVRANPGATQQLSFDFDKAPFDITADRAVRRAVALALDRQSYVAEVLKGNGEPGRWLSPPSVLGPAAELVTPPVLDPALARTTLEDAGWVVGGADGVRARASRRLTLTLIGGPAIPEAGLRFVQSRLAAVGIEVAVKKAADRVTYEQFRDRGYDVELTAPNQNDANPAFLQSRDEGPETDAVLAADTREAVQRLAAQISQKRINEDYLVVPLAGISRTYALRQGVDLLDPHPSAINQSWTALVAT
jgi:peptide/nickel transport system substrate-binding protein